MYNYNSMAYPQYNPYGNNYVNQQPQNPYQAQQQTQNLYKPQQPIQQNFTLQGKVVDSIDVVKATDIPLDGSISYFALSDNSAIVTKQLQPDGTSKVLIYRPIPMQTPVETPQINYVTQEQMEKAISSIKTDIDTDEIKELQDKIKSLEKQIETLSKKKV